MIHRPLSQLHEYQVRAIRHCLDHPNAALWMDMGLGKTAVILHVIADLVDRVEAFGAIVVAPLRVCQIVWRQEAALWEYTRHLTFSLVHGTAEERVAALRKPAQIYLVNYENLPWLVDQFQHYWIRRGKGLPANVLVMDEVSRLKSTRTMQGGLRGRRLLEILPYFQYRYGLTGVPAPNGLLDLFGQYLCIDGGARLGRSYSKFQQEYFYQMDYNGWHFAPFESTPKQITELIGDITLSMKNADYLKLPPLTVNDIDVLLPAKARKKYDEMEKQFFLELDSGETIDIGSEASLVNRCLQVAGGSVYLRPGGTEWEKIHDAKMKALEEIVEEAAGEPILLAYQFRHEAERILWKFRGAKWINSRISEKEMIKIAQDWDQGKIPMLIGHRASMGHGLNLQKGSNILVEFGQDWSHDLSSQTRARLLRQGQEKPVFVYRLIARDTMDEVQRDVLETKAAAEATLRSAVKAYRDRKK